MNDATTLHAHPAPHRDRAGLAQLAFVTMGGPAAWGIRLLVKYAIASHVCFPGAVRLFGASHEVAIRSLLAAIDVATVVIAAFAALMAYRIWESTRHEFSGHANELLEIGEGRTRFLALWGIIIGTGFLLFTIFDLVAVVVLPLCA